MAKLGYHIAAGMMQGLGAGIIENAKQQREAALRAMDLQARREEGAAERASREALSAKELASREAQHSAEIGMRKGELEGARADRELARKENAQYRQDTLEETRRYHNILDANNDANRGMRRNPNEMSDKDQIDAILKEADTENRGNLNPNKRVTPEEIARKRAGTLSPNVLKHFGIEAAPANGSSMQPGQAPPKVSDDNPPSPGPRMIPQNRRKEADEIIEAVRSKAISVEEGNRRMNALFIN